MDRPTLISLIAPVVAPLGLEVDRVEVRGVGHRQIVRVMLDGDGPAGTGPDLDQISEATKLVSASLDEADMGSQPYVLEVSSRGVGARLTTPTHFRRNVGRLVSLTLADGRTLEGRVESVSDDTVQLRVGSQPEPVTLAAIRRAVVQVEFRKDEEE